MRPSLYLPGVEANPQPGVYKTLVDGARARGAEYSKIWDLFAFRQDFTIHMGRFTHGLLRQPATQRADRLTAFLTDEVWPQVPAEVIGRAPDKAEREAILGYGPEGV